LETGANRGGSSVAEPKIGAAAPAVAQPNASPAPLAQATPGTVPPAAPVTPGKMPASAGAEAPAMAPPAAAGTKKTVAAVATPPPRSVTSDFPELGEIQRLLVSFGYEPDTDGSLGAKTIRAIRLFQQENGVPVDGRASSGLLQYMQNLSHRPSSAPKSQAAATVPQAPVAAVPEVPAVTEPQAPVAAVPEAPAAAVPEAPAAAVPQASAVTVVPVAKPSATAPPASAQTSAEPESTAPAAAQLAANPPAAAVPGESAGEKLPSIIFAPRSADLTDQAKLELDRLAARLAKNAELHVQLMAYAAGSEAQAEQARLLSYRRSLNVRDYLIGQHVAAGDIDVRLRGIKLPDNGPPDRVDPVIIAK
jgi:outer membrane protein OmpA-like peptidoglycan-associated protein